MVRVSIEPLPALHDVERALDACAPAIHDGGNLCERHVLLRGDPEPALRKADVLVDETWRTSWQEHVYLEPQGALAVPDADGGVTVRGSIQCPYHAREKVARVLGIPEDLVRVAPTAIGGGFGGKQDYPNEVAACAALLARLAARPVKLVYDRSEDIRVTSKRHPFRIRMRLGARRDGTLLAARVDALADAGPYAAMSPVVLWRAFNAMAGPYRIPDVAIEAKAVHTNNPPASAFRGFGHPQALFAHEGAMDELAARLGIDPLDLRERNILRRGDANAAGHVLDADIRLAEVVASVRQRSNWAEARRAAEERNARGGRFLRGLGVALLQFGCGLGALDEHLDRAEAVMRLAPDGAVEVRTGLVDMGQGSLTALAQIAAGALGITLDRVRMLPPLTSEVGDCGPSAASRVTMVGGAAIIDAAAKLRSALGLPALPDGAGDAWDEAVARALRDGRPVETRGSMRTAYGPWDPATGQGEPFVAYTHAAHVAAVEVDTATGRVRVEKVWAAYDIGTVVNPSAAAAQIEGGVAQGLGYALLEDLHVRGGRALNADLSNYLVPTSLDVPEVDVEFVEGYSPPGPFGAKSLGEPAFVPAASAIVAAIRHATGLALREMPVTAERLFLQAGGQFGAARLTPPGPPRTLAAEPL
ncbi:MAG: molybdopterin-dependent oxidoreductase, partial [Myxococcota bacterium]|nr:molybdopterin-dependent oxidoreductase [Myxococcota bacterium]